ncbi:MAG: single-stranded-DNA-specific exonuclease RecJ, partial [Chloroflexota bacterium]
MPKKWILPAPPAALDAYEALIPWVAQSLQRAGLLLPPDPRPLARLIGQLLAARGIAPDHAAAYFECADDGGSPFQLKGMNETVARLRRALKAGEAIAVYGDYDVDGVTATALMVTTLKALGGNASAYIPHRVDDGYGLNNDSLDQLKQQGIQLVISVDCGVRAVAEADYARSIGLDLLITDHHAVPDVLPATTVINPRQPGCAYPFKELSGVGLAYKVAQALLLTEQRVPLRAPPTLTSDMLLDFVALGTVADVVPLRGENRHLVRRGLQLLNNPQRIGIKELIMKSGTKLGKVNASTIGFALGPRLNAAGRMEHAKLSYELLMASDKIYAENLATKLDEVNRQRQEQTKVCVAHVRERVLSEQKDSPIVFAADPEYPQGIVGLVASRLAEEFYRPALVIERRDDLSKGSARTIPEFNIIAALDECADVLLKHGGHKAAAGFTLQTERLPELRDRLSDIARRQFDGQALTPTVRAEAEVAFTELDRPLLYLLEQMEPFGAENPSPLFVARNVGVRSQRAIGKDGDHLRMTLVQHNIVREAVAFRHGKEWAGQLPPRIDIAFAFEWNEYNGARAMQLNVK